MAEQQFLIVATLKSGVQVDGYAPKPANGYMSFMADPASESVLILKKSWGDAIVKFSEVASLDTIQRL